MTQRKNGFTLVETLVSLTIVILMLAVTTVNFRGAKGRADTKSAADVLASSLRQARQASQSEKRTVAVAFPTSNGALSHSSGFYRLAGETKPQISERVDLKEEFAQTCIFGGEYLGPTWSSTLPGGTATDGFTIAAWDAPYPQDHFIAFLPNGTVVSDLRMGDGSYRLVVAKAFQYSGSPATLTAADSAFTVLVTPTGQVSVAPSVVGATAVATQATGADGAPLPPNTVAGNNPPQMVLPYLAISPSVNALSLAKVGSPGATATVPQNGMLTFTVYATDPDGDQLWCKWTGPGSFSCANGARMVWNESAKHWVGQWTWRVPKGANVNDKFLLTCRVYDNRGGTTSPVDVGLAMPQPAVIDNQSLLCAMLDGVYRWNWDGTGAVLVIASKDVGGQPITKARWSPDSSQIAFVAGQSLYLIDRTGQNLQLLYSCPYAIDAICWSRSGLNLFLLGSDQLVSLRPDPSSPGLTTVATALGLTQPASLTAHPLGAPLLTSDKDGILGIWPPDSTHPTVLVQRYSPDGQLECHTPAFNLAGDKMYMRCRETPNPSCCYDACDVSVTAATRTINFTNWRTVLNSIGTGACPVVSPDGLFFAGGMTASGDRLSICPATATSNADAIDVTAIPPTSAHRVVDVDWGYY